MSEFPTKSALKGKMSDVVLSAFCQLNEPRGVSLKGITSYIKKEYDNIKEKDIRKPVADALRRGCVFGFLKRDGYNYKLGCDIGLFCRSFLKKKSCIRQRDSLLRRPSKRVQFDYTSTYNAFKTTRRARLRREPTPFYPRHSSK